MRRHMKTEGMRKDDDLRQLIVDSIKSDLVNKLSTSTKLKEHLIREEINVKGSSKKEGHWFYPESSERFFIVSPTSLANIISIDKEANSFEIPWIEYSFNRLKTKGTPGMHGETILNEDAKGKIKGITGSYSYNSKTGDLEVNFDQFDPMEEFSYENQWKTNKGEHKC